MLENILVAACEGHRTSNNLYIQIRAMLLDEPSIKQMLPSFVAVNGADPQRVQATTPLLRLAAIVRGADTGRMDAAPQAAGLLAASLGLSRMYADDLAQLEAGFALYDAFYRWCRDATEETHTSHSRKSGA